MSRPLSLAPSFSRVWAAADSGNRFNGFGVRMLFVRSILAASTLLFSSGCVVFPRSEIAGPLASGVVVDAATSAPIAQARVTRLIPVHGKETAARTDAAGAFNLKESRFLVWLAPVCWAPTAIRYQVECSGYAGFATNLSGGGSFAIGRKPHDLGRVALERSPR